MKKKKFNISIQILIMVVIIVVANIISGNAFRRIDLTDDDRNTVSEVSKELLRDLPNQAFVTVYYGGDLPTHYKEFEERMETFLHELSLYADGHLDYQFVNPDDDPDIFKRFNEKGLPPFRISAPVTSTSQKEALVLPYAQVTYRGKDVMMNLIHNCLYYNEQGAPDFIVECALQRFEYNILTTIYNMSREKFKTVGFLTGHGEYPFEAMSDLARDIDHYYNIIKVDLSHGKPIGPSNLDLLIVQQPDSALTEREKYEIDQYIMRGGQAIFLMDHQILDFSIGEQASTLTFLRNTNLDDFFMKHGVKLNYDLVQDGLWTGWISTTSFTATFGNDTRRYPWSYYPLIRNVSNHPTTRYLAGVLMRYGSSIDTFNVEGIKKTVLFKSSPRSRRKDGRQFINIDQELKIKPDINKFTERGQIMGIMLEGNFRSLYGNRPAPTDSMAPTPPTEAFTAMSGADAKSRVVIISDGEFATGELAAGRLSPLPEENKVLMMNLIDYMTGQEILSSLRIREYHDRMLDYERIRDNETRIRIINIGFPVLIIVLFGFVRGFIRKRKNNALKQTG